ncbi:hypothetical protein D3C72_2104270 [compost metagenome]
MNTRHATVRAQQRGIPPMIDWLLDLYGHEEYDHQGAILVHFNSESKRRMEKELGRQAIAPMCRWFGAYKVKTTDGSTTLTTGFRTKHIKRK